MKCNLKKGLLPAVRSVPLRINYGWSLHYPRYLYQERRHVNLKQD